MWIHMHCPCLQVDKKSFFTKTDLFHTIHNNENWWLHDSVPLFAPYIANAAASTTTPSFFVEPHFGKFRCTYSMKLWIIVAKHDSPRMLRNRRFSPKHRSVWAAQFKAIHYLSGLQAKHHHQFWFMNFSKFLKCRPNLKCQVNDWFTATCLLN